MNNALNNMIAVLATVEKKMEIESIMPKLNAYQQEYHPNVELKEFVEYALYNNLNEGVLKSGHYFDKKRNKVICHFQLLAEIDDKGASIGYVVW